MSRIRIAPGRRALLAAAATLPATPALANAWGAGQTITIVVPFAAGSGTDGMARILANLLGEEMRARVVVDNRSGANGTIAATFVARAAPDGRTVFVTTNTTHAAAPVLQRRLDYDPVADFTPITRIGALPCMLVVGPHVPATTLREFLDFARRRNGAATYASGNSTGIIAGATIARMAGAPMTHVPYRSTPPAMADVMGGRVDSIVMDIASGLANVRAERLRILAVTGAQRSPVLPQVPTLGEAGLPGFDIEAWVAMFGPAALAPEALSAINGAVRRVWDRPEIRQRMVEQGFETGVSTPEELDAFVRAEIAKWSALARAAGIEPE